jgi:uncharacterized protein
LSLFGILMEIDLTQLEAEGVRVREAIGPRELGSGDQSGRVEPLRAELSVWLRRERGSVRATGELAAAVRAECDRCLKPLEVEVAGRFDQRYVWGDAGEAGAEETEVELAELDVDRLAGPVLDTRDLAREQLELAVPIRIVCSEGCKGLCPVCGADRNATDCGCEASATDPRWAALEDFKKP